MNKSGNILVSIICNTYNHEPYIRQCLEGFVMQKTDFAFEVLIHDDASTDKTADIIREYENKYPNIINPIYQTENQYSKGIKIQYKYQYPRVRGKYIALCEGDDYWIDPCKLQKQVDFLDANPEYSMCFHRANILNELESDILMKSDSIENREYTANELFCNWIVPTASILFIKDIIDYTYIGKERMLNGDICIILTCAMLGKIRGFNDIMSIYRMHPSGITYDEKLKKTRIFKYPEHFHFIKENFPIVDSKYINRSISQAYFMRIFLQETIINKIKDLLFSFYYYPSFAIKGVSQYIIDKLNGEKRIIWIDILNIIACIGVIMLHCSNHEIHKYNGNVTCEFIWGCFTHTIFFWPVPIFLMISGANLLEYNGSWKRFYQRRIEKTVIPFLIWSILYCILLHRNNLTLTTFLQHLVSGTFNSHMWFFIPLFAFYLSVPFLTCIVKYGGKRLIELYLIISFICLSFCPFIFGLIHVKFCNIFPLANSYLFMPMLGYYLVKYPLQSKFKNHLYKLAILAVIIHWGLIFFIVQYKNELKNIVLDYDSPLCMLMACAVFIYMKDIDWKTINKKINNKIITIISSCSLGIYLIHNSIIIFTNRFIPEIYEVLDFVGVYIISLCIIYIMKRIPIARYIVP